MAVTSSNPDDWHFLGEGNANLVVTYVGSACELRGRVLRVRKKKGDQKWDSDPLQEAQSIEYLASLFSENYRKATQALVQKHVQFETPTDVKFLEELRDRMKKHSREQEKLYFHTTAQLCSDYTWTPSNNNITIEIKPKFGSLTDTKFVDPANAALKAKYCRFCMHQKLKEKQKNNKFKISGYCPLDFFSGEKNRLRRAVSNLLLTPQNNLNVFAGRELVYGQHIQDVSQLSTTVKQIFGWKNLTKNTFHEFEKNHEERSHQPQETDPSCLFETDQDNGPRFPLPIVRLIEVVTEILLKESLLPELKALQNLCPLDIEAVYILSLLESHSSSTLPSPPTSLHFCSLNSTSVAPSSLPSLEGLQREGEKEKVKREEKEKVKRKEKEKVEREEQEKGERGGEKEKVKREEKAKEKVERGEEEKVVSLACFQELLKLTPEERQQHIQHFLTSATFRDLSLMLTIEPANQNKSEKVKSPDKKIIRQTEDRDQQQNEQQGGWHLQNFFQPLEFPAHQQSYWYRLAMVDIDKKDAWRIPKWFALDQEVVNNFSHLCVLSDEKTRYVQFKGKDKIKMLIDEKKDCSLENYKCVVSATANMVF